MYEHGGTPPLSRAAFLRRLAGHFGVAGILVLGSLLAGMAGYHFFEHTGWLDSFLDASMILGGMGPVGNGPQTSPGKLFAGLYALYSGMVFLVVASIVLAPVVHRILHRFHWEADRSATVAAAGTSTLKPGAARPEAGSSSPGSRSPSAGDPPPTAG